MNPADIFLYTSLGFTTVAATTFTLAQVIRNAQKLNNYTITQVEQ